MGYFITGNTINIQTDKPLIHKALNNQLYMDDGTIYLCPKNKNMTAIQSPALNLLRTINNKIYCLNIPKELELATTVEEIKAIVAC